MKILIADDEQPARFGMSRALRAEGRTILEAENGQQAFDSIVTDPPDLVLLDLNMPVLGGLRVLKRLQEAGVKPLPEIIVVTANDSVPLAVECIRAGAADFLTKPYDIDHLRSITRRTEERVRLQNQLRDLREELAESSVRFGSLLGVSPPMRKLFGQIQRAAGSDLPVLIRGESGTGKELIARELHQRSRRSAGPFVAVNTAAISSSLIESELFGHIKGAFTGADRAREGVFRKADGGTLFLDEIGDMPASVQTRLLRVLQEGIVQPVGSEDEVRVDVRIVSATHQDLETAMTQKTFRQDLYFRLRGIELSVSPLRDRREDIVLLAQSFLPADRSLRDDAIQAMMAHLWPGNVRELQQVVSAAAVLSDNQRISATDLRLRTTEADENSSPGFSAYASLPLTEGRNRLVEDFERFAISSALEAESGNVSAAARRLGIHRQNLQQKMKQLGMRTSSCDNDEA